MKDIEFNYRSKSILVIYTVDLRELSSNQSYLKFIQGSIYIYLNFKYLFIYHDIRVF